MKKRLKQMDPGVIENALAVFLGIFVMSALFFPDAVCDLGDPDEKQDRSDGQTRGASHGNIRISG